MAKYRWLIGYAVLIAILAIIPLIVKSPYYLHIFIIVLVNAILGITLVILSSIIGMVFPVTVGNIPFVGGYNGITGIPKPDPIIIPGLLSIEFNNKTSLSYLGLFLFVIVTLACSA